MNEQQISITESDFHRIKGILRDKLLDRREEARELNRLDHELHRAHIVKPTEIPKDVVTMNSRVRLRDLETGETMVFSLVYPSLVYYSAGSYLGKVVSVLTPVGTAMLGGRVGDTIEWDEPSGLRRLKVEEVLYQPEAVWRYDL